MYVCLSNVNIINTIIIMKKIIYLALLSLITGLAVQAQEKTGEWNGCDRYDFTFKVSFVPPYQPLPPFAPSNQYSNNGP